MANKNFFVHCDFLLGIVVITEYLGFIFGQFGFGHSHIQQIKFSVIIMLGVVPETLA